jgi:hypothetical protein
MEWLWHYWRTTGIRFFMGGNPAKLREVYTDQRVSDRSVSRIFQESAPATVKAICIYSLVITMIRPFVNLAARIGPLASLLDTRDSLGSVSAPSACPAHSLQSFRSLRDLSSLFATAAKNEREEPAYRPKNYGRYVPWKEYLQNT